jgi:hypothetical protein
MDTIITRIWNTHGEKMFLCRMDQTAQGWAPVWTLCRAQAVTVTETYAQDLIGHINAWRDQSCPNGIAGVSMECVA